MEVRLPYEKAQAVAEICQGELGISVVYRLLERRIASRYSPGHLKSVYMRDTEFLRLPIESGSYDSAGVWATMTDGDFVIFKLRFLGKLDYTQLAS